VIGPNMSKLLQTSHIFSTQFRLERTGRDPSSAYFQHTEIRERSAIGENGVVT
jgi:hypothetical protein